MARAKDLKQKLKAADRRRKRRPSVQGRSATAPDSGSPAVGGGSTSGDVVGLMAQAILDAADRDSAITDGAVVTALRCSVRLSEPSRDEAQAVLRALEAVASRDSVPRRKFSQAAEQLVTMAVAHKPSDEESSPFLRYLSVLVR